MWPEKKVKQSLALLLIVVIGVLILYALRPYVNAFLGAFILLAIFKPLFNVFIAWRWPRSLAAVAVILLSIFVVLLPLSLLISIIAQEAQILLPKLVTLIESSAWLNNYWRSWSAGFDLTGQLAQAGNAARTLLTSTVAAVSNQLINYVIMYFLLYFLLVTNDDKLRQVIYDLVPFSEANALRLAKEFKNITYATLLTTGLIALVQGSLLTVGFLLFDLPGAFLWGFVGGLASFIPFLGAPSIWLPTTVFLLLSGRLLAGFGFLAWGIFISNIDNVLRPIIQRRVAQIHPLVSLLGIFIGLSLFGIIGIVLGPLLLSYFLLTVGMFRQEYIKD